MTTLDRILLYLAPLAPLLENPAVTEVMVNEGGRRVFYEVAGRMHAAPHLQLDPVLLKQTIQEIAAACGSHVSDAWPILTARLDDGSRVAAVLAPVAVGGHLLSIRRFGRRYSLVDLVAAEMLSSSQAVTLADVIAARLNVLIVGAAGSGKTTLLNALAALIPADERIVLIEETAEIFLTHPNLIRLEARPEERAEDVAFPRPAVTLDRLLEITLRLRPDRIILGEVRKEGAKDLLDAWNTGHAGSLSTMHANSAAHAPARWRSLILGSQPNLSVATVDADIAAALQVTVHCALQDGVRRVTAIRSQPPADVPDTLPVGMV